MDNYTRNALWDLWTKTTYIEDNYPKLASKYRSMSNWGNSDIAEFLVKNCTKSQIKDMCENSPYDGLSGCGGRKKKKSGCLSGGLRPLNPKEPNGKKYENYGESEIRDAVYKGLSKSLTKAQIKDVINVYWDVIGKAVKAGKNVQIFSVGSMYKYERKFAINLPDRKKSKTTKTKIKFDVSAAFERDYK